MAERPYSRYTRERTWAAVYSQHMNAGYALVPYSRTNNSIDVIWCKTPQGVQEQADILSAQADVCRSYYELVASLKADDDTLVPQQPAVPVPDVLKRARHAVVLAKSSDYHHYHLVDYPDFKLVICGLHDSYLRLTVWETRANQRYSPRQTAVSITSPDFERIRCTQFGHTILVGALVEGDQDAIAFKNDHRKLPARTRRRIEHEVDLMQHVRYQGRPLAFLTDAERQVIGAKISEGLKRYHAQRRLQIM
jgi:hypothetical protein